MAEFPCLPLWTDALIGDTHQLTPAEFGAYLRLLIVAWRREDCNLPDDDAFLGRSVGDPKNWHRLRQKVLPYFSKGSDGFLRQHRLTDERTYARNLRVRSSAGGRGKALKERHLAAAKKVPKECQKSAPLPLPIPPKEAKASLVRATRWPPSQELPFEWIAQGTDARVQHQLQEIDLRLEAEKFANYWSSKGGKDAAKLDWRKTWINWALRAEGARNGKSRQATAHDKFLAAAESLIREQLEPGAAGSGDAAALAAGDKLLEA